MPEDERPSLRAEQVAQTRQALVEAARQLFGARGYAATSVDDVARAARVTSGALYHHFPTKTALFEAVFGQVHGEMLFAAEAKALQSTDPVGALKNALDDFLDANLDAGYQRIVVTDAPAVLGLARYIELDEQDALGPFVAGLIAAGVSSTEQPEVIARMVFGMLTRAAMMIATSSRPKKARDQASAALHRLIDALVS